MPSILTGIPREAQKGQGGIRRVFLSAFGDVTDKSITAGVFTFSSGADAWKEFKLGKESGSNFVETGTGNVGAGTVSYEQILTMIFKRNQAAKRTEAKVLGENEVIAVIEDNNGDLFIYGAMNGLDMTSGVSNSGAQYADANGMTITLRGLETQPSVSISAANFESIVAGTAII